MGLVVPAGFVAGVAVGTLIDDSGASLPAELSLGLVVVAFLVGLLGLAAGGRRRGGAALLAALALVGGTAVGLWRAGTVDLHDGPGTVAGLVGGGEHRLAGIAADDARPKGDRQQVVLDGLRVTDADGRTAAVHGRLLVWLPRGIAVTAGDRVGLSARLEEPRDFDGFAYREFLARQGIAAIARAYAADVRGGDGPVAAVGQVRRIFHAGLNSVVPEPEAALGSGILLGVRSGIAPEVDEAFATAGLTHVVAISGWNIAIVAALVAAATGPLARRPGGRPARTVITVGSVAGYVLLTGASPSVVRAALMAGAILLARLGGSRAHAGSALMAAAGIMLLAAPGVLWDVGFQLSLLATAGLIWFGGAIERRLGRLPAWLREPVALTLAAQLTTLPVILLNFERLSVVAPLANVVVVPLVPLAMAACAVASIVGAIQEAVAIPALGEAASWAAGGTAWLALRAMIGAGTILASLPVAALDVALPPAFAVAWYPILGLAWWARAPGARDPSRAPDGQVGLAPARREPAAERVTMVVGRLARPRLVLIAVAAVLATLTVAQQPDGRLHLSVLDVGQGDAVLVETPSGATMLVDGGPDPELTLRRLGEALPFFVRRIDVVILSHPHQDHVAGLVDVLSRFEVGLLLHAGIDYDNAAHDRLLADGLAERGGRVALARAGMTLSLDRQTSLEILYPGDADAAAPLPDGDINNGSVVALLRHGRFAALLTGDAEAPVEAALLARGLIVDVDVLKVGHHGSHSSTTAGLVELARPELALISAGAGNEYGHPAAETLATLATAGVDVLRTDLHGTVEVVSDGSGYVVIPAIPP